MGQARQAVRGFQQKQKVWAMRWSREISHQGTVGSKGSLKDRVSLVRKNHAWMIGERIGSRCTTEAERDAQEKAADAFS